MSSVDLILPLFAAAGLACLPLVRTLRAASAAERSRAAAAALADSRGRSISLAVAELQGLGLSLSAGGRDALARQLLRIADDLAAATQAAGPRALKEVPAPLGPVLDAAIAAVAVQIRPGRRHWQVDPALRALTLRADARALQGAIAALLRRAAQHSADGDVVALRQHVAGEMLAIVVEDEGDGLVAPDLAGEAVEAGGTRGLDLGLSLARSLAAAHGGDIRLESAPGIGARAWLTLPRERLLQAA